MVLYFFGNSAYKKDILSMRTQKYIMKKLIKITLVWLYYYQRSRFNDIVMAEEKDRFHNRSDTWSRHSNSKYASTKWDGLKSYEKTDGTKAN